MILAKIQVFPTVLQQQELDHVNQLHVEIKGNLHARIMFSSSTAGIQIWFASLSTTKESVFGSVFDLYNLTPVPGPQWQSRWFTNLWLFKQLNDSYNMF